MIVNAPGVVLSRRNAGEADRVAVLFTEELGKLTVRFTGVNRAAGKLKAISEPLVWGEYRLYLSPKSEFGKVIGGRIIDSFPALRDDLRLTAEALSCCELLASLTVERNPSPAKYRLICGALGALSGPAPSPWLSTAFGLQLLDLAGFSAAQADIPARDLDAWRALHEARFGELDALPWRPDRGAFFRDVLYSHAEAQTGRQFKSRLFMDNLFPPRARASVAQIAAC